MTVEVHIPDSRFGTAVATTGLQAHAVDLEATLSHRPLRMAGDDRETGAAAVFSVCGSRGQLLPRFGAFTYESPWLAGRTRCERCSWVVALTRGTVEQEIELYAGDATAEHGGDLLRQIFTSILADAPPEGGKAQVGHRSDLLAHAARHRPVLTVCEECGDAGCEGAHGPGVDRCPHASSVCVECSFVAGSWAGEWEGTIAAECEVPSPCSTLVALAHHYGISLPVSEGRDGG